MKEKLVWARLKDLECPKCGGTLVKESYGYRCGAGRGTSAQCTFYIQHEKFDQVVASLYKPRQRSTEDVMGDERLAELNNYGRERVSEDFSDSPFADCRPKYD